MSAHVLLNLLNELGKRDKMQSLPSILSHFRNKFNKFNNTGAQSNGYFLRKQDQTLLWTCVASAQLQCVNNHYAKLEYKGMKSV